MIRGGSRRLPVEASLGSENSLAVYESAEESLTLEPLASGTLPTPRDGGTATPPLASPQGSLKSAMPAAELALQDTAHSPSKDSRTLLGGGEVAGAAGAGASAAAAEQARAGPPAAEQSASNLNGVGASVVGGAAPAVPSDSSSAGRLGQALPDGGEATPFGSAGEQEQTALQVEQQQLPQEQRGHLEAAVDTALPTSNGSNLVGSTANGTPAAAVAVAAAAAASSSGRSTAGAAGSSMVSVPMSNAPDTGIFSIPEEAFRIRDLDTGKEYALDKRYWVKNLDTGTVYVLESEQGAGAGAEPSKVTELLSGRELSINQFEGVLGYFREPHKAPGPQERMQLAEQQGLTAQQLAQKSLKSINAGASWVKQSMSSAMHRVKQGGSPRAGAGDEFGAAAGGGDVAAAGAGGVDERQGVPVKVYRKSFKEFTDLRLVQRLTGHQGVVWTMKFSRNGKYLASAGQDCTIQVWEVVPNRTVGSRAATPTALDRQAPGGSSVAAAATEAGGGSSSGRVFAVQPYRVYTGHKQDVLDLCWSKTQFLLSASMDKTVRLWHVTMDECLRVFKHTDFVTAIDFHPSDDKMFLSGSIDGKVRLWNIPEQRVVSWQDVHEMVTAVSYAPDGRKAVVGTMKGKCRFYSIQNNALEYEAQLDVKNKRGQHARGKKITGLQFLPTEPGKLLITSNDSRIRLYDGYTLRCKYKGHSNRNTQIRASLSPQGDFITCGSDDGWVYIWATRKSSVPAGASPPPSADANPFAKEKNAAYECFQANGDIVTVAVFAPESTHRQLDAPSAAAVAAAPVTRADAAGASRQPPSGGLGDRSEGEAALAAARARGQVIITAGYSGEVKVYENSGLPQWL